MKLPKLSKKMLKIVLIGTLVVIVLFIVNYLYASTHPLSNPQFGFQYYKPIQLPAGFHITEKRINIESPDGQLYGITAELNLRTVDWSYEIRESRTNISITPDSSTVSTKLKNYDTSSIDPTCLQVLSPNSQSYRLCHWVDYGTISVYEVNFIKGHTYIGTEFPARLNQVIPVSSLSAYVDSFVKAKASGFSTISGGP
jgi:hypothetical protein